MIKYCWGRIAHPGLLSFSRGNSKSGNPRHGRDPLSIRGVKQLLLSSSTKTSQAECDPSNKTLKHGFVKNLDTLRLSVIIVLESSMPTDTHKILGSLLHLYKTFLRSTPFRMCWFTAHKPRPRGANQRFSSTYWRIQSMRNELHWHSDRPCISCHKKRAFSKPTISQRIHRPFSWRIIPVSKGLVTTIYKPLKPFGREPILLGRLASPLWSVCLRISKKG